MHDKPIKLINWLLLTVYFYNVHSLFPSPKGSLSSLRKLLFCCHRVGYGLASTKLAATVVDKNTNLYINLCLKQLYFQWLLVVTCPLFMWICLFMFRWWNGWYDVHRESMLPSRRAAGNYMRRGLSTSPRCLLPLLHTPTQTHAHTQLRALVNRARMRAFSITLIVSI